MKTLLLGYGEVGKAIHGLFKDYHFIKIYDPDKGFDQIDITETFDVVLVTIPYSEDFQNKIKYKTSSTIIFSTIPIGTTRKFKNAVHCPIEGKHPDLLESVKKWNFIMGGFNDIALQYFHDAKIYPIVTNDSRTTELAKLQSTSFYGVCIEYMRYINDICSTLSIDFNWIKEYNKNYNELYSNQYCRPILDPPNGAIGGHCVVPNAILLDKQYPSEFLKTIIK